MKKNLTKQEVIEIVKKDGMQLKFFPQFSSDHDVVITALNHTLSAIQYIDRNLSEDSVFIMRALQETPWALYIYRFASRDIQIQPAFICEAVKGDCQSVVYAGKDWQNKVSLARIGMKSKRHATLENFGPKVRSNESLALEILKDKPREFIFLEPSLKNKYKFLVKAVGINQEVLKYMDETTASRVMALIQGEERNADIAAAEVAV